MLNRRSFFAAAAGALAGAAGVASAAPVTGVEVLLSSWNITSGKIAIYGVDDWANDAGVAPSDINAAARAEARFARMQEIFKDIRGEELPAWPYPSIAEPNDLTREQLAANLDLPVIGEGKLPREMTPEQKRRHDALVKECEKPIPIKETWRQYLKRMSLPCPGRLE